MTETHPLIYQYQFNHDVLQKLNYKLMLLKMCAPRMDGKVMASVMMEIILLAAIMMEEIAVAATLIQHFVQPVPAVVCLFSFKIFLLSYPTAL